MRKSTMKNRATRPDRSVLSRRAFLATTGGAILTMSPAFARDAIHDVIQTPSREWAGGFDAATVGPADVLSSTPTISTQIIEASRASIAEYSAIASQGGWPIVPTVAGMRIGFRDPAVVILRQRLMISRDLARMEGVPEALDSYVEAALKRFQARHGIDVDGVVGESTLTALNVPVEVRLSQLTINLDRLATLVTASSSGRFVMVNIPAARVEAVEENRIISLHTAVVGRVDRQSPVLSSKIHEINFHPFWTVPASIIRRDLIPLMRKDPGYLTRYRIRIYDPQGVELDPKQVDWMTDEATRYLFRQDPWEDNSLGTVKINFPNAHAVYMHDTPNKSLFNDDYRFDSSGCVRIQNVRDLVKWILRDTPGQTRDQIDEEFRSGERLDVRVVDPIPVHWSYITAWATADGIVNFRNDIYSLDNIGQYAAGTDARPL